MSAGKYSPTVTTAYMRDQKWHDKYCVDGEWIDPEGYDSYGYYKDAPYKDRAGYTESDYLTSGRWDDAGDEYVYPLVEDVWMEWTFDGVKPVKKEDWKGHRLS